VAGVAWPARGSIPPGGVGPVRASWPNPGDPRLLAFDFRWGAVNERQLAEPGDPRLLAFDFRWGAV